MSLSIYESSRARHSEHGEFQTLGASRFTDGYKTEYAFFVRVCIGFFPLLLAIRRNGSLPGSFFFRGVDDARGCQCTICSHLHARSRVGILGDLSAE